MSKKILIIEDDPAILLGLEQLLVSENYSVIKADDGMVGLNNALEINPDLILLDIYLPSINGIDVCRKLREKAFVNPIIMLTSKSELIDKVVGLEVGSDDYITKPFDTKEVLARIRAHLRQSERTRGIEKGTKKNELNRKLLAILFSDMKEYSKKMNKNEALTIQLLNTHNKILKKQIKNKNGHVVEIIGDAFLVSFNSAVAAVECAVNIQGELVSYNFQKSDEEKIEVRIGIHLGDVIQLKDNLKGDTINIAARIQQEAIPGSVFVSDSIFHAVNLKVNYVFKYLGKKQFKNIKILIDLYEVLTSG